jgi:hypothetical protein
MVDALGKSFVDNSEDLVVGQTNKDKIVVKKL